MKNFLRSVFSPILNIFEKGEGEYIYKPSHRKILVVVGILFLALSSVSFFILVRFEALGGILPAVVFFSTGAICGIVGCLGTDNAVARIWKNK